jgi:hypothetical protein
MASDPVSDILKLVNAETVVSGGFTAGGSWAVRFPASDEIKFCAIVKGNCCARLDGEAEPVLAAKGDVLLLSARRSFVLASDLGAAPVDAIEVFAGNVSKIAKLGDGDDFSQIGGHVRLDPASGGLLADVLPPWIHIRAASRQGNERTVRIGQAPGA